jgi:hypothetical protein
MRFTRRWFAVIAVLGLTLAACGGGEGTGDPADDQTPSPSADGDGLAVFIASYDLAVGEDRRLIAGVLTQDQALVAGGELSFQVAPLDDGAASAQEATARFLPVPGMAPAKMPETPTPLRGVAGTGVYEAFVTFDRPGMWALKVSATLDDGRTVVGSTQFEVAEHTQVLDVGDPAHRTENLTIDDVGPDVPPGAIDSRAHGEDPADPDIPDPHIHDTTIAEALDQGRPVVALFSTPVYCVSRFCGPITEEFAAMAQEYDDRAAFVHVEVWFNFEDQELNEAAAEWIQTERGGNEPWVFLIDGDGTVLARWDNVLDADALREALEDLPAA